jgi:hypothetical protein
LLAVAFHTLRVATPELAGATSAGLERIAKALSERLTYLMEPIRPIELDAGACVAQLRSSLPQRDDDGRSYYELVVRRRGEILLCRFRKEPATPRQQIPATVTGEALLRVWMTSRPCWANIFGGETAGAGRIGRAIYERCPLRRRDIVPIRMPIINRACVAGSGTSRQLPSNGKSTPSRP